MDKANREFDKDHATRDAHGNITARNQNGLTVTGKPRKSARESFLDADEKDMRPVRKDKNN